MSSRQEISLKIVEDEFLLLFPTGKFILGKKESPVAMNWMNLSTFVSTLQTPETSPFQR